MAFFIIEKVSGFFSRIMGRACCCCLNKDTVEDVFSNNIYGEMSEMERAKAYTETKDLQDKIKRLVKREAKSEFKALREYYAQRLLYK